MTASNLGRAELALVLAIVRTPAWLERHAVPLDCLCSVEARRTLAWVLERRERGEHITLDALAAALPDLARVWRDADGEVRDECWEPDAPALMQRVRAAAQRRGVLLAAEALRVAATDPRADLPAVASRVSALLAEVAA
jgi:hypothetical protein